MRCVLEIFNSVHFNRELGRQFTPKFKFSGGGGELNRPSEPSEFS